MGAISHSASHSLNAVAPRTKDPTHRSTVRPERLSTRIKRAYRTAAHAGIIVFPLRMTALRALVYKAFALTPNTPETPLPAPSAPFTLLAVMVVLPRHAPQLLLSLEALYGARDHAPPWLACGGAPRRLPAAIRELTAWGQRRSLKLDRCLGAVACATVVNNVLQITETLCAPLDVQSLIDTATLALTAPPL
jgi:hypothetical protein